MRQEIIIDGLLISYLSQSPLKPELPTVLFLHGWRSEALVWKHLMETVQADGMNIIAIDMPGFGLSEPPKSDFRLADYSKVITLLIEKLHLENVSIVGHSFGGRVGIKLAASHFGPVKKLLLIDSAGFKDVSVEKSLLGVVAKLAKPLFKPHFMQPLRKQIYKSIGAEDYLATPKLQKIFVNITQEDLSADMEKIAIPTFIIFGELDTDTPPESGRRMQSLIKKSTLHILPGAGHFSFLDKPEYFKNAIINFINS